MCTTFSLTMLLILVGTNFFKIFREFEQTMREETMGFEVFERTHVISIVTSTFKTVDLWLWMTLSP
jgi:hypothetical protein